MMNKRMLLTLIATTMLVLVAQSGYAAASIDIDKSKIEWLATKVTGQHNGTLTLKSGQVDIHGRDVKAARFVFDMNSIKVLDIEEEKWNSKLVNHLKSDDFFSVDKYPTATFELTSAKELKGTKAGEPNFTFSGELTIKGITHAVTFDALIDLTSAVARAQGRIIVDRTKYDIRYRSGSFFENLGDKTIHDEFTISFDVVTK